MNKMNKPLFYLLMSYVWPIKFDRNMIQSTLLTTNSLWMNFCLQKTLVKSKFLTIQISSRTTFEILI